MSGLEPLDGLVSRALVGEPPAVGGEPAALGGETRRLFEHADVAGLAVDDGLGHAVGGHEDGDAVALFGRQPFQRLLDAAGQGVDKGGQRVPRADDAQLAAVGQRRLGVIDGGEVAAHDDWASTAARE